VDSCEAINGAQYCVLGTRDKKDLQVALGVCVPQVCKPSDVTQVEALLGKIKTEARYGIGTEYSQIFRETTCGERSYEWTVIAMVI
jgi:hypothetical protein